MTRDIAITLSAAAILFYGSTASAQQTRTSNADARAIQLAQAAVTGPPGPAPQTDKEFVEAKLRVLENAVKQLQAQITNLKNQQTKETNILNQKITNAENAGKGALANAGELLKKLNQLTDVVANLKTEVQNLKPKP